MFHESHSQVTCNIESEKLVVSGQRGLRDTMTIKIF